MLGGLFFFGCRRDREPIPCLITHKVLILCDRCHYQPLPSCFSTFKVPGSRPSSFHQFHIITQSPPCHPFSFLLLFPKPHPPGGIRKRECCRELRVMRWSGFKRKGTSMCEIKISSKGQKIEVVAEFYKSGHQVAVAFYSLPPL